jgi:hypothetical protein
MGGANSALITGVMAQMYHIPLVCITTFGGSAENVWSLAIGELATKEEQNLMGQDTWNSDSAKNLVRILGEQRTRLQEAEARQRQQQYLQEKKLRNRAIVAAVFILVSVGLTLFGTFRTSPEPLFFGLFFFSVPLLAGASGAISRNLFDYYQGKIYNSNHSTPIAIVLGMLAGLVSSLLFMAAQLASNPAIANLDTTIPRELNRLIAFELIIGIIAGFTLEAVLTKIQSTDVVNTSAISVK